MVPVARPSTHLAQHAEWSLRALRFAPHPGHPAPLLRLNARCGAIRHATQPPYESPSMGVFLLEGPLVMVALRPRTDVPCTHNRTSQTPPAAPTLPSDARTIPPTRAPSSPDLAYTTPPRGSRAFSNSRCATGDAGRSLRGVPRGQRGRRARMHFPRIRTSLPVA
jgi:hypothetical protein